ncbi:ABC transporter substrate-binding protein [Gynuella sunshinyii]|uniref:Probable sugar-binding periplasmic protein n=1 Tax=Gynuella sunshinyii YC6258 TaxID=1445510 RepID=A0A0C5VPD1_9GAMM|nr:ABC transporter substrate-binding protein [Gynuella sunshinyii]AJQ96121.1 ABC-type sugar transport system, periplasmic component [Gynuella sunshinyii YC6258]
MTSIRTGITVATLSIYLVATQIHAGAFEVLHWWTSAGETRALDFVHAQLSQQGIDWRNLPVTGGAGEGAMAVLKTRVLAGQSPVAAQLIGPDIQDWATLGFLTTLDEVASQQHWSAILHPTVDTLIQHQGHYVAVPFGIHRINWLWINRTQLQQTGLGIPQNWDEFFNLARKFQQQGIIPLAHGNEPWQNTTLFETLVLSLGGPRFYRSVFVDLDEQAILSDTFADALRLFARMRSLMDDDVNGRSWHQSTALVADGRAGMQIMGDWVKGELSAWGKENRLICAAVPETRSFHLYSIDTMVLFQQPQPDKDQQLFATTMTAMDTQLGYSLRKGAIPVRKDIDVSLLDPCARDSYLHFVENEMHQTLAPSLAHSMALNAEREDVFIQKIHRFFQQPDTPVEQVQAEIVRNLKPLKQ